jgi:CheY-like chemotaxis protein
LSTWMVVEDEPDIYEVLLAMFEMWGIDGVAFVDGEEAATWLEDVDSGRYQGELPELALLDIRLPGKISGPMVGERIRKSKELGDIAIIMSTAYKLSPSEEQAVVKQAGADKLMYKPMPRFDELQRILEAVIAQRRAKISQSNTQPD